MSNSIGDLLAQKQFSEPDEVHIIKQFLNDNYQANCSVAVNQRQIIINVSSASLAGALRLRLHELQALCQTEKRLVIRIS